MTNHTGSTENPLVLIAVRNCKDESKSFCFASYREQVENCLQCGSNLEIGFVVLDDKAREMLNGTQRN